MDSVKNYQGTGIVNDVMDGMELDDVKFGYASITDFTILQIGNGYHKVYGISGRPLFGNVVVSLTCDRKGISQIFQDFKSNDMLERYRKVLH